MLIYIAAPYHHKDPAVIQARMEKVYKVLSEYVKKGELALTPLFMHEVATRFALPGDFSFWDKFCFKLLERCDKMVVLKLEGWEESRGVEAEIEYCKERGIPVEFKDMDEQIENRVGKFLISRSVLTNLAKNPNNLKTLFGRMLIVRAENLYVEDGIEYTAMSDLFDKIPECEVIPRYSLIIHTKPNGDISDIEAIRS